MLHALHVLHHSHACPLRRHGKRATVDSIHSRAQPPALGSPDWLPVNLFVHAESEPGTGDRIYPAYGGYHVLPHPHIRRGIAGGRAWGMLSGRDVDPTEGILDDGLAAIAHTGWCGAVRVFTSSQQLAERILQADSTSPLAIDLWHPLYCLVEATLPFVQVCPVVIGRDDNQEALRQALLAMQRAEDGLS